MVSLGKTSYPELAQIKEKLQAVAGKLIVLDALDLAEKAGIKLVCWDSPNYPLLLKRIDQPPPLLYVRGDLQVIDELAVAIVGTRNPTSYGKEAARHLANDMARNKVTIVSGLALGIDGIAHQAALCNDILKSQNLSRLSGI